MGFREFARSSQPAPSTFMHGPRHGLVIITNLKQPNVETLKCVNCIIAAIRPSATPGRHSFLGISYVSS